MPKVFSLQRGDRAALLLTLGLWAITYPVFMLPSVIETSGLRWWKAGLMAACVLLGLVLSPPLYWIVRRTERMPIGPKAILISAGVLVVATVVSIGDALILGRGYAYFDPSWKLSPLPRMVVNNFLIYFWLFSSYAAALALLLSSIKGQERERQLSEARTAAHQAQLAALRFQLNPHFLFNTLNAISTLIVTSRNAEAEVMMQKLSEFLRASLASDPEGFITLEDELNTMHAYLEIESVRFGDRLAVEVACPPHLHDAAVPSFILQPLVENAVKYAVAPARRAVTIRVEAAQDGEDLVVTVEDDGDAAERVNTRAGTGVGLQNVRRRLEALYGPRGTLEALPREKGFLSIVRLPLMHSLHLARAAA